MTIGLSGLHKADILVGRENNSVPRTNTYFFDRVGIDMIAGQTESLILADAHADADADADIFAADLVGQAEHG
mgnify:CR=1 FL=1